MSAPMPPPPTHDPSAPHPAGDVGSLVPLPPEPTPRPLGRSLLRPWFPVGFLLLAAACTADSEHPRSGHSMAGDWWELSQVPSVVLGDESADGSPLLYRIREGTVLPSGNIVLTQPQEVLRYARNGDFEGYIGREGKGPGEFLITTAMSRLSGSDHIRIMDLLNRRVTTMTSQGEVFSHLAT